MATRVAGSGTPSGATPTSTTSATVFTTNASVTFTPDPAGGDYLIIGRFEIGLNNQSATPSTEAQLFHDTASTQLSFCTRRIGQVTTPEWYPTVFMKKVTFAASQPSQTFSLGHKLSAASGSRASVARYGIVTYIKLDTADKYVENDAAGTSTATAGTFSDYTDGNAGTDDALIFTPGSTGDYLFLAVAVHTSSSSSNSVAARLALPDGTFTSAVLWLPTSATTSETTQVFIGKCTGLTAVSQTCKLQHGRGNSTPTSTLKLVRIVAFRIDGFNGEADTYDTGRDTTTSSTVAALGTSHSQNLEAVTDYLVFGRAEHDDGAISADFETRFVQDSTVLTDAITRVPSTPATLGFSDLYPAVITGAGATSQFDFRAASGNNSATLGSDEHGFFVLTLTAPVTASVPRPNVSTAALQRSVSW